MKEQPVGQDIKDTIESMVQKFMKLLNETPSGISVLRDVSNANTPMPSSSPFNCSLPLKDVETSDTPWTPFDAERTV